MKYFHSSLLGLALGAAVTTPSFAMDDYISRQASATVGVYFKIPFTGGLRQHEQKSFSYGFAIKVEHSYRTIHGARATGLGFRSNLLDLKFGPQGFENLALAGQDVINGRLETLGAAEGKADWTWIGVGAVAIGLAVALGGNSDECAPGTSQEGGTCLPPVSL